MQPADEGQGSSGDHRVENVLEFLTLRALLPRPTPLPCFLQTSSFHSLSFPLEQPGKSLEGDTAQHPTANTQPGLTLHAGCCGLRVSPVGPLSKPETGALLLPPPFHRGASWGVGWHSQPWRSAGTGTRAANSPDQGARWEEASCLGLLEHIPVQVLSAPST